MHNMCDTMSHGGRPPVRFASLLTSIGGIMWLRGLVLSCAVLVGGTVRADGWADLGRLLTNPPPAPGLPVIPGPWNPPFRPEQSHFGDPVVGQPQGGNWPPQQGPAGPTPQPFQLTGPGHMMGPGFSQPDYRVGGRRW